MAIIKNTYGKILAIFMAWLGFSAVLVSCSKYGVPEATFKAKGVVVSQTDDAPVEGIHAVLKGRPDETQKIDAADTNGKGVFNLKSYHYESKLYVELSDEGKGLFNDTVVVADFSHVKFKGSDRGSSEVEKDLGIIKMRPKK